jgi:phosphoribosylformylglycinamidine synthase
MHFGIIVFPAPTATAIALTSINNVLGHTSALVWHENTDLSAFDAIIVPGGFAHGDYLRTGAIARFSPVMDSDSRVRVVRQTVIGICNGFQIFAKPGCCRARSGRNASQHFICRVDARLRVENNATSSCI